MDRVSLPKWLQYGEYLLTFLCAISIGLVTVWQPFKTGLPKSTKDTELKSLQMEETQRPNFEWVPITSNQLQKRVFDWLFAPGRELHSQHSTNASRSQSGGHRDSYSLSLVLPAHDLTPLWQLPKPMPTWPGWNMTEATGIHNGSTWQITLRWEKAAVNLSQSTSNIWRHHAHGIHTTQFQPALWHKSTLEKPLSSIAVVGQNTPSHEQLNTPPAHMVGFIESKHSAGAWLTAFANEDTNHGQETFFLPLQATWQGWQLQQSPQHIFYLNNGKYRWQLHKCQYVSPCLL